MIQYYTACFLSRVVFAGLSSFLDCVVHSQPIESLLYPRLDFIKALMGFLIMGFEDQKTLGPLGQKTK